MYEAARAEYQATLNEELDAQSYWGGSGAARVRPFGHDNLIF